MPTSNRFTVGLANREVAPPPPVQAVPISIDDQIIAQRQKVQAEMLRRELATAEEAGILGQEELAGRMTERGTEQLGSDKSGTPYAANMGGTFMNAYEQYKGEKGTQDAQARREGLAKTQQEDMQRIMAEYEALVKLLEQQAQAGR